MDFCSRIVKKKPKSNWILNAVTPLCLSFFYFLFVFFSFHSSDGFYPFLSSYFLCIFFKLTIFFFFILIFFSFLFCSLSIFVFQVYRPQLFIYFLGCIVIVIIEKSKIFFQWKLSFQSCHEQRRTTNKNRFFATIVSFLMSAIECTNAPEYKLLCCISAVLFLLFPIKRRSRKNRNWPRKYDEENKMANNFVLFWLFSAFYFVFVVRSCTMYMCSAMHEKGE